MRSFQRSAAILSLSRGLNVRGQAKFGGHELYYSNCSNCHEELLFQGDRVVLPEGSSTIPRPNDDLAEEIKQDYMEAASIYQKSPRGACALLRLALQKLCRQLGQEGKNPNEDIDALVHQGLPVEIQQALDSLRVIGNNAVHPGELDLRDGQNTAEKLFSALNLIAERLLTQKKKIAELFGDLPQGAREQITKRDASS